jgi:hypothetical protein
MSRRKISNTLICAAVVFAFALPASAAQGDACTLLSQADITKATGLSVGAGELGKPIPGVLSGCTWTGSANGKVIVTLADTAHMQLTIQAQQETGGTSISGLGSKAVGIKGAAFTGGGYIISFLDAKGGVGVSILGREGTPDRVVALAKVVESHR